MTVPRLTSGRWASFCTHWSAVRCPLTAPHCANCVSECFAANTGKKPVVFCLPRTSKGLIYVLKRSIPFYMSSDCENLLRKFLVLNPAKRATLETIMRDKWMNMGYEEDELKPFIENAADLKDPKRIGKTGTVHDNLITYSMTVCSSSRLEWNHWSPFGVNHN